MLGKSNLTLIILLPCLLFIFILVSTIENSNPEIAEAINSFFLSFSNNVLAQETNWINYTSNSSSSSDEKSNNLTTKIPPGWQITEDRISQSNQTTDSIVFLSPKEGPNDLFQENIVLSIQKPTNNISLEDNSVNTQEIVEKLGSQYNEFSFENMSSTIIGNFKKPAESVVYSFRDLGLPFKAKQVFLTSEGGIYIFSLLAEQNQFDEYVNVFDQVLKHIRLTN
jgi:archaellum component FlaF (FlaF/FlaG flagellin family)